MSYFVRETRHNSPPKRTGIHVGGPVVLPAQKDILTRDQIISQNIDSMQPKNDPAGQNGGVMRFIGDTEDKHLRGRNVHKKADNDIFGPPVINPAPRPRIRPGVTEEELQKIWREDDAKARAQNAMASASNLVEKMVAEPAVPAHVQPGSARRPKDAVPPGRKQINLFTETTEERSRQAHEPAGFAGMGLHCRIQPKSGVCCKPLDDFVPPELKLKPRQQGRRTRFPADQLSFNDGSIPTY